MDSNYYLRQLQLDMQMRAYSTNTQEVYSRAVRNFLNFCNRPIAELDERDVRNFTLHLMASNLSRGSINLYQAGVRFFFGVTLNRNLNYLQMPRLKEEKSLPEILSREEISALMAVCENLKHKAIFALAYGSGLRVSEICSLRVQDIDSVHMRVFVRNGKGAKDRYTILSQTGLEILRDYWRKYRPHHPNGYLFPGSKNIGHITDSSVNSALRKWLAVANISKRVSIHSLRHSFASHMLEDGADLFTIKELMGHNSISSTTVYLHLANVGGTVSSPIDCCLNNGR